MIGMRGSPTSPLSWSGTISVTVSFPIRLIDATMNHSPGNYSLEGEKDTWMHPKQGSDRCFHRDAALG